MRVTQHALRYAQRRITRKMIRAVPYLGGLVALLTLRAAVRRKGVVGGTVHTALDFVPVVGGVKNLAEAVRGRDFIKDRQPTALPH